MYEPHLSFVYRGLQHHCGIIQAVKREALNTTRKLWGPRMGTQVNGHNHSIFMDIAMVNYMMKCC